MSSSNTGSASTIPGLKASVRNRIRPTQTNEWWSCDQTTWNDLLHTTKSRDAKAAGNAEVKLSDIDYVRNACENGRAVHNKCQLCEETGIDCMIADPKKKCALCRWRHQSHCSRITAEETDDEDEDAEGETDDETRAHNPATRDEDDRAWASDENAEGETDNEIWAHDPAMGATNHGTQAHDTLTHQPIASTSQHAINNDESPRARDLREREEYKRMQQDNDVNDLDANGNYIVTSAATAKTFDGLDWDNPEKSLGLDEDWY